MKTTRNLHQAQAVILAAKAYDILIETGQRQEDEMDRFHFIHNFFKMLKEGRGEYRFQGKLGFGGKIWVDDLPPRIYVTQYREDETKESQATIKIINEKLAVVLNEFIGE